MTSELCERYESAILREMEKLIDAAESGKHGMSECMINHAHELIESLQAIRAMKALAK